MPRGKQDKSIQETASPATSRITGVWAMMTSGQPEYMADWDYNEQDMAVLVGECLHTGAAITFGAKRDLSGMNVRVFAQGQVVFNEYFDNCFALNESMKELGQKLRQVRLAELAKGGGSD